MHVKDRVTIIDPDSMYYNYSGVILELDFDGELYANIDLPEEDTSWWVKAKHLIPEIAIDFSEVV